MDLPSTVLAAGAVGLGYLSGSVPMGVIVARLTGRTDPRAVGSGRTGGTNAVRALGWSLGLTVGLLDVVKGALPLLVARSLATGPLVEALGGIAAIAGANRSLFLRFQGGRGVATGLGALLVIDPRVVAVAAPVFVGVIAVTRYVSLGSLIGTASAAAALVLLVAAGGANPGYLVYALGGGLLIWLAHADNIERLLHGAERRFSISHAVSTESEGG